MDRSFGVVNGNQPVKRCFCNFFAARDCHCNFFAGRRDKKHEKGEELFTSRDNRRGTAICVTDVRDINQRAYNGKYTHRKLLDGDLVRQSFNYTDMVKGGDAYYHEASNIAIISPPDGMCFYHAIASQGYPANEKDTKLQDVYVLAAALSVKNDQGQQAHTGEQIATVCRLLNISCMSLAGFSKYLEGVKPDHVKMKAGRNGAPILPCILTDDGHVCVAIDYAKRVSKKFSYDQLLQAFEFLG